ncbi:MAG TPA: alpha/beta hydrolase [Pyrinomonadaceae bacterium]|nr:alpha/beta hydrolase [Pyrinomonadaceae bacterium]
MKTILLFLTVLFFSISVYSQDITGRWGGMLDVSGQKIPVIFNIVKEGSSFKSTLFSPSLGKDGIPVDSTTLENNKLSLKITALKAEFSGELNSDGKFVGTFSQNGMKFPLTINKGGTVVVDAPKRPQEPKPPFSYYSEDIKFTNPKANIKLAGTLTLPKKEGKYPVIVMITGSGPENRNEEIFGHKPFLVIADHLAKNGIGVLRFDDRGFGESEGTFGTATSEDFASDVESAVTYLKTRNDVNLNKIGLIGHSEGGIIAPMVAANSKDVAFIVLLAGPGISGYELLPLQGELINRASGMSEADALAAKKMSQGAFDIVMKSTDQKTLEPDLIAYFKKIGMPENEAVNAAKQANSPWMQFFLKYDPKTALKKVKVPVLAVNGEKDLQVPADIDLKEIKETLENSGNKNVTIIKFPKLNHLFQECDTGLVSEYGKIEQTFSPIALKEITDWIVKQTK